MQTSTNAFLCLVLFREWRPGRRVSKEEDSRALVISVHPTGNKGHSVYETQGRNVGLYVAKSRLMNAALSVLPSHLNNCGFHMI